MNNVKTDFYYVSKIAKDMLFITEHIKFVTKEEFDKNEILQDSMMFRLIQISENSDKLSADFKDKYKNIPWHAIKGMRNRLVHEYGNVDYTIVYNTIKNDIPTIYDYLKDLV